MALRYEQAPLLQLTAAFYLALHLTPPVWPLDLLLLYAVVRSPRDLCDAPCKYGQGACWQAQFILCSWFAPNVKLAGDVPSTSNRN